ncbi:MAG: hypothetical protein R3F60_16715 [bacterium]
MWILYGVIGVITCILVVASTRPSTFRYVRATTVKSPAKAIFDRSADFRRWRGGRRGPTSIRR